MDVPRDREQVEPLDHGDFVLPPRHRLFAIFDDRAAAQRVIAMLQMQGFTGDDDIWLLSGEDALARVDANGERHGLWGRTARALEHLLAHSDTEYLEGLEAEVRRGRLVLAVLVSDEKQADEVARAMRAQGGRSFAYGAHWNFVPVVP